MEGVLQGQRKFQCLHPTVEIVPETLKNEEREQVVVIMLAEEEGFEPPCESPRKRFSRPPVSTTHPFLRSLYYPI